MVISHYISTFIKSLAMINYVCIYIIKMHLLDNYNAEYFTNNYNAESITSVEKMNYHRLLRSHFSMFERYRNCEIFCNFYAILFIFFSQNVLSHIMNRSMHRITTLVSSEFLSHYETIFQPDRYWNMCCNHLDSFHF